MEYTIAFALRCALACTFAYEVTAGIGMSKPVCAAISALVVSQERLTDTGSSVSARIAATVVGAAISLSIGALGARLGAPLGLEVAVAVAVAASIAHRFPRLRVAMWTCPVLLLTAEPSEPLTSAALQRACEVVLGASVGWAFHWATERAMRWGRAAKPTSPSAS